MKKWMGLFLILLFSLSGLVFAEKVVPLSEVLKAEQIVICHNRLYVADQVTMYIYSLNDFKLIKKFGKRGEGPEEFMDRISGIAEGKDYILISSQNKASFFTPDGVFLKEHKAKSGLFSGMYQVTGKNFVGVGTKTEVGKMYFGIFLFDGNFNFLKELAKYIFMEKGKFNFLNMMRMITFFTYKDKIYMAGEEGFTINILDSNGEKINTITRDYKPKKVTAKDKENIKAMFKRGMPRPQWEAMKDRVVYYDHYPVILFIQVADDTIYVFTWKQEKDLFETFLYNLEGRFIKRKFVRLALRSERGIQPYPATFYMGKLFQLVEDEDDEVWKLHITELN